MKKWLTEKLICPECVADEVPLDLHIEREENDDVIEGELICSSCKRTYPIRKGVAVVLPEASRSVLSETSGYNSKSMLSSYLWSHFCDFLNEISSDECFHEATMQEI